MNKLSANQRELISSIVGRLAEIPGMKAVVLGGSHARGRAQPNSDIDLGLFYSEVAPFSIDAIRALAESINDTPSLVVTDFYGWGPWVNGGAWLTIRGQRVDFIYRNIEHVQRVITDADAGRFEVDYLQQPPFGFFSGTYLGEIAIRIPQFDPESLIDRLKKRVTVYPEAMREAIIQDYLWQAEFNLEAFAPKFAARADAYGTTACLTRAVKQLIVVLFALNRQYLLNDKTALAETTEFQRAPEKFAARVQTVFQSVGASPSGLQNSIQQISELFRETVALVEGIYKPRFTLPK